MLINTTHYFTSKLSLTPIPKHQLSLRFLFCNQRLIINLGMKKCNFQLYCIVLAFLASLALCGVRINKNLMLVDDQDRQLQIHGGCVVVKVPPYFPNTATFDSHFSFVERDYEIYKELGMNGVRLGAMWAGVEPKKDWYNETYLEEMVKFVNELGKHGIYTLVDFHQDIISEKFCGDGVPIWLIDELHGYKTFPYPWSLKKMPLNSSGLPSWSDCDQANWGKYYFAYDVGDTFNHLYNTNHYLHKKFVAYWKKVASYLVGNPYVIAYELINEPFVGNAVRNPFLILPSVAERLKFQKFYDSVVSGIREVDNDTNICFEPITFDFAFGTGFTHAPGGNKYKGKSILCYHYESPPVRSLKTMSAKLRDMKRLGIPVLMSEFGGNPEVRQFVEDHHQNYFYWQYKDFGKNFGGSSNATFFSSKEEGGFGLVNPDGSLVEEQIPNIARTILHRTAGTIKKMNYRVATGHFSAVYEATPGGTSVLYISKNRIYKNGFSFDITPSENIQVVHNGNYVDITYKGKEPTFIMINIEKL